MRRPVIVLLVASILVIVHAGIALGKGPESVTFTGAGIDSPVELMDAVDWPISCDNSCPPDPMVQLMEQSGLWYATGDLPIAVDEPEEDLGPRYVLTWVRSGFPDESVEERTLHQFIYLQAEDGPVIHTPEQEGLVDWGPRVVGWFRASEDLPDTLVSLGAPMSAPGVAGSVGIGVTERLGLFAAFGSAVLVVMWGIRRRSAHQNPRKSEMRFARNSNRSSWLTAGGAGTEPYSEALSFSAIPDVSIRRAPSFIAADRSPSVVACA